MLGAGNNAGGTTPELRLFDVDHVEVLRGPQGTLYGGGSMGGTLRVIFKKPDFKTEGAVDTTVSTTRYGGLNDEINAMVNLPLIQDLAALRVTGFFGHKSGYIDNVRFGWKDVNKSDTYGGRILLRVTPAANLTIDAAAYINRLESYSASYQADLGFLKTDDYVRRPVYDDSNLYSLTAVWNTDAFTVTGSGSYFNRHLLQYTDTTDYIGSFRTPASCSRLFNGGSACSAPTLANFYNYVDARRPSALAPDQHQDAYTAELRMSSNGSGPFKWTVGGFYSDRVTDVDNAQPVAGTDGFFSSSPTLIGQRVIKDKLKQVAAFGEVSYEIIPNLTATAGARYFKFNRSIGSQTNVENLLISTRVSPLTTFSTKEDGAVFKGNLSYQLTPDVLVYGEASQGFRPGGANSTLGLPTTLTPYQSDKLWNYTLGAKTQLFDRKLTLNVDLYQIDWKNIQVSGRTLDGAFSFIANAGSARVRGVEVETSLKVARGLTLQGNFTYTDAILAENQTNALVQAPGLKGDRIPEVPKYSGGAAVEYITNVTPELEGSIRVDGTFQGGFYSDFRAAAALTRYVPAYQMVNIRAGVSSPNSNWGVYVFATNLLDNQAIVSASASAIGLSRTQLVSASPRTIGVNLHKSF